MTTPCLYSQSISQNNEGDYANYYNVGSSIISRRLSGETSNPSTYGKLKNIYFENLGYANVTTIETTV